MFWIKNKKKIQTPVFLYNSKPHFFVYKSEAKWGIHFTDMFPDVKGLPGKVSMRSSSPMGTLSQSFPPMFLNCLAFVILQYHRLVLKPKISQNMALDGRAANLASIHNGNRRQIYSTPAGVPRYVLEQDTFSRFITGPHARSGGFVPKWRKRGQLGQ